VGLSDTRGIKGRIETQWDAARVPFRPGPGGNPLFESGIHAPVPGAGAAPHAFAFTLALHGSEALSLAPLGVETTATLRSTWPHPSFAGAFLPETRAVSPSGFAASWRVSQFGRSYGQQWRLGSPEGIGDLSARVARSTFGVALYLPADGYQQTTRSLKYGVLFIGLTFGAFFLFEVLSELALHPLQYLLVGLALALFYLLLLSISEHTGFAAAYGVSAAATVALVTTYAAAILARTLRAFAIGGLLAALYAYLYVLLRAEDDALLMGALALFVILALVMYGTRRIDWHRVAARPPVIPG
jgi:inner membrane protein